MIEETSESDRGDDFVPTPDPESEVLTTEPDGKVDKEDDKVDEDESKVVKEEEKDEEKDPEEKDVRKNVRIPRARLTEATEKFKAREAVLANRIKELESRVTTTQVNADIEKIETSISTLSDKYEEALLDGKKDEARRFREEKTRLERQLSRFETEQARNEAREAAVTDIRYESVINSIEAAYPVLNPDHEEFDQAVMEHVLKVRDGLMKVGDPGYAALREAVNLVVGPPEGKGKADAASLRDARAVEARKKAVAAAGKQPPELANIGQDSDKAGGGTPDAKSIARMTQDEFAKLDDKTLARLRGDIA